MLQLPKNIYLTMPTLILSANGEKNVITTKGKVKKRAKETKQPSIHLLL
jgi:hypothetical protein